MVLLETGPDELFAALPITAAPTTIAIFLKFTQAGEGPAPNAYDHLSSMQAVQHLEKM